MFSRMTDRLNDMSSGNIPFFPDDLYDKTLKIKTLWKRISLGYALSKI